MTVLVQQPAERFSTDIGWLNSKHSFNFGEHYSPAHQGHGLLLVNNDDWVAPASGFGTHGHRDMEIVTWVISGTLEHRDSEGNHGVLYPGLAQRMSAGTGIRHSEMNPSPDTPVHFVQMWVPPDTAGIKPGYEQLDINESLAGGGLVPIASGKGHEGAITIHQRDAVLWGARLAAGESIDVPADPHVHVFVAAGSATLSSGEALVEGAAARLVDAGPLALTAAESGAEVLIWATAQRRLRDAYCARMEMHFATVWESFADTFGDVTALVHGSTRRTWAEYDERAGRVAAAYLEAGLQPDSKVGLLLYNGNEYLESQFGVFKIRGVPINVNYRYLDDELAYLLENSDAEALVFHSSLGERVARIVDRLPKLRLLIEVDDGERGQVPGALAYEEVIAAHDPSPRITRAEDDIYMLYTGGTTGMPKGVMYAVGGMTSAFLMSGFNTGGLQPPREAAEIAPIVKGIIDSGDQTISIPCAPLMHGTGLWIGAFIPHLIGANVITLTSRSLDADEVLSLVQGERVTNLTIVGDAFAKPLIAGIDAAIAAGKPYDTSSVLRIVSSGVMWTAEVKNQLIERIEQAILIDAMGSTEGSMGVSITMKGLPPDTAKFTQNPTTKVFTDDDREVQPGSDEVGMVAAGGNVPLGYYKDPEKSARTFRVIDGVRYSFPGDMAKVAADGSLILLGRGSQVINSGGEKIFPEEVEEAVKRVDGVLDCLCVGLDDERFGQSVTAVVSRVDGATVEEGDVIAGVKRQLAGYKAPKVVVFVERVPRAPNGKADYKTAKQLALDALVTGS